MAKERGRRYPTQTITDADYDVDVALLANTPTQAESLGIDLHVNANKSEYMCFNQKIDISTLKSSSLKLADKFTYFRSNVSSTETDINTSEGMVSYR